MLLACYSHKHISYRIRTIIALFTIIRTDRNMLLACYSHKHISYRIRTIIRKAIRGCPETSKFKHIPSLT
ncbi:hypothetical protein [Wolbachia endosymbiont (group A) of Ischnus inquisitorius]|uniref:hypothetical protein n=1 Tax=Wolbachia endosymbiont (group A) of Ischnus inquisitorius TaxID=3077922 RepID=UPI0031333A7F